MKSTNKALQIDSSWSLFLDRDGVINKRKIGGYIQNVKEFQFLKQVPETLARLSKMFQYIFVVTNQQGIAKKLMTESDLAEIHAYMVAEIERAGGKITKCYHAPHLHTENNRLRKPNIGMGLLAKNDFPTLDFSKAIMVGDSDSDIEFGKKLGMITVRIQAEEQARITADFTISQLHQLPNLIE